jgi:hypothetical protein
MKAPHEFKAAANGFLEACQFMAALNSWGLSAAPRNPARRWGWLGLGVVLAWCLPSAGAVIEFERDIRPILKEHCMSCHGAEKQKSNLRLDRKVDAFKGGDEGVVLVPGRSADSRLFKLVSGADPDAVMPPKGPRLTAQQVAVIQEWIDAGAPWPEDPPAADPRQHWAFQPPTRPPVPGVATVAAAASFPIRTPVDAFIVARHRERGLAPSPEAGRSVLIRRLSLDLLGLPPSPAEVDAFVNDASPGAYEALVERLLSSVHYGERWGRHWLDLARYAETEGFEGNTFRASAWRYRDYVVNAFNTDKPHDRFLLEQLAGDELEPYADENLIATGFLSNARYSHNEEDKTKQRNDVLVDIANATASVTLGLTMACAQCHDHKFDPLSLRDYYRWQGFFARGQLVYALLRDEAAWREYEAGLPAEFKAARTLRDALHAKAETKFQPDQLAKLDFDARRLRDTPQEFLPLGQRGRPAALRKQVEDALAESDRKLYAELMKRLDLWEAEARERKPQMWAYYSPASSPHPVEMLPPKGDYPLPYDVETLRQTRPAVLVRGEPSRRGAEVGWGWPEVLGPPPADGLGERPRTALARWLTSTNSPLTARVWVNYVWQQHFGRGLVATPEDFGVRGESPSHPELLDWLACELMTPTTAFGPGAAQEAATRAWSTKHLHRLIVLSSAYRQASRPNAQNEALDAENRLLWRWMPRRLEAETIRDAALAVSGELDVTPGGPSVATNRTETATRRTLYLRQARGGFARAQEMFDGPTANESCPRRHVSTVPLQPLFLLNDSFWLRRAEALAAQLDADAGQDRLVAQLFRRVFSRPPEAGERALAESFLASPEYAGRPREAVVHLAHALLNSNEFVYLE